MCEECRVYMQLGERFRDFCNNDNSDVKVLMVMKDLHLKAKNAKGEFLINKIQDIVFDEVFFKYISYKPLLDVVQSIIGPNITAFHSMLINKPPNTTKDSSRHPLHQDLHYFPFGPSESVLTTWTAMEKVNEQNGCLFAIPGSHKGPLYRHEYPPNITNIGFYGVHGFDHLPKVNFIMDKGDTVLFHSHLLHGSGPNFTQGFRKAILCSYADSNCVFINSLKGTTQENVEKVVLNYLRKNGFGEMTLARFFKEKSALLRGKPGNFQKIDSHL
ncbi:hypothetical protein FQA39_LY19256 [Lamprigera yunnana]|nr:hypothetical protein FQA39_LY19256 [Lamprigera yunnana]